MKKLIFSLLALLPLLGFAQGGGQLDMMQVVPNDPLVRTGTLDCGITYYIKHNAKDPQRADFHIMYHVGAIQEEDHQNGLAHFLEHMAFNGSKNFQGNAMIDYLESIGVRFGENLNAGTSQEYTTYMIKNVPLIRETITDSVLLVLHDWAGFINLDHKDIDEERGVIREELRGGRDANSRVRDQMSPYIFNNSIYAKRNVIGTDELLQSFSYSDIESFYHKWYRPDLQSFVIVGDFDVDEMEAKLKAVMSDIKEHDEKAPREIVVIEDNEKPLIVIATDPEYAYTMAQIMFRHEPMPLEFNDRVFRQKRDVIATFVNNIMGERFADITQKENAPFTQGMGTYYMTFMEPFDAFYALAVGKNDESLVVLEALYTELLRMQRGGFTASEFERAKAKMMTNAENNYKNRNDVRNSGYVNMYNEHFLKNIPYATAEIEYELTKQILETTTLEEINAEATNYIRDKNSVIMIAAPSSSKVPTEAEVTTIIEKVKTSNIEIFADEVKTEPLIDPSKIKAGKISKTSNGAFDTKIWKLSNGVTFILKHTDLAENEILLSGTQKGGLSQISDLNDLNSIVNFAYMHGNAGLGNFSQTDLTKMLAGKRVMTYIDFGENSVSVGGQTTPADIETMFQLVHLRMTAPRIEQTDFNVTKNQLVSFLTNLETTPDFVFAKEQIKITSSNYERALITSMPSIENLEKVSVERMKELYKDFVKNANGMTFTITGNFDEATLKPLVEKYIASLPSNKKITPAIGDNFEEKAKGIISREILTPMETPKVTVMVAYSGDIDWTIEERINIAAINHIINVRYTKSIREEAGGTYGVRVNISPEMLPTPTYTMVIQFDTDEAKVDELLPIVFKEIEDMMNDGVSEENFRIFKEFSTKNFADRNNFNGTWQQYVTSQYVWNTDYYTGYEKALEGVTNETIKATAKKLFTQGNVITMVQKPAK